MERGEREQRIAEMADDGRVAIALLDVVRNGMDDADEVSKALKMEAVEHFLDGVA
jgi:hypothetical protein